MERLLGALALWPEPSLSIVVWGTTMYGDALKITGVSGHEPAGQRGSQSRSRTTKNEDGALMTDSKSSSLPRSLNGASALSWNG